MLRSFLLFFGSLAFIALIVIVGGVLAIIGYYGQDLPDHQQLANYEPPITTRLYASDGKLLEEYATQKRFFVPQEAVPILVKQAFLAAEDKNFYLHHGVDFFSVVRAVLDNLRNLGSDRRLVGASTITQQVAKNFLLNNEVSLQRKVREAILAFRMEKAFTKDRILELYLNQIFLGIGSYGVAAAAITYFNKSLDELTINEAAYLAALPKGPNLYHPLRNPDRARDRRDWVLKRMVEERFITREKAEEASQQPIVMIEREQTESVSAPFFAEEVRRIIHNRYGQKSLYESGLVVRTTVDPDLQEIATRALRKGLVTYDQRHGWRGPIAHMKKTDDWEARLGRIPPQAGQNDWRLAVVLKLTAKAAGIGFANGTRAIIPWEEIKWARAWKPNQRVGALPKHPKNVLHIGDVVPVEATDHPNQYALRQIPDVQGAIAVIDPQTGRVRAMQGGYSFAQTKFNRATQAMRQPGSAFKPFVYLAALEQGYGPATVVLDAPFVHCYSPDKPCWKPDNYTHRFYGPTPMRKGIELSRNLMTVRLAQGIGIDNVAKIAEDFGIFDDMLEVLPMALGAGETTLLRLTTAYAQIVNGGRQIIPSFIDRIQDRNGQTIYRHDQRTCKTCRARKWENQSVPILGDRRKQLTKAPFTYQIVSMLQGVVKRGTASRIGRALNYSLAGKTGTTNDNRDTWFVGFSPDLAVGVFVGFDEPRSLGDKETGSRTAAPIFQDFMTEALKNRPVRPFRMPTGIRLVAIDPDTGQRALPSEKHIMEAFIPGTEPDWNQIALFRDDEDQMNAYKYNQLWQTYEDDQNRYYGPGVFVRNNSGLTGNQEIRTGSIWNQIPLQVWDPSKPEDDGVFNPSNPNRPARGLWDNRPMIDQIWGRSNSSPNAPGFFLDPQQEGQRQLYHDQQRSQKPISGPVGGTGGIY